MPKLKLCRIALLLSSLAITSGCAINPDVCADEYMTASRKDTAPTQKEILAHNEFLKKMGCPETGGQPSLLDKFRNVF